MGRYLPCSILLLSVACFDDPPPVTGEDGSTSSSTAGEETVTAEGSTTGTISTVDPDSGTSEVDSTGVPAECTESDGELGDGCPDVAPFCVAGTCTPCTESPTSCGDAGAPGGAVCDDSGRCVECNEADATACGGTAPICDAEGMSCVACTAHDQCPGNAGCHLFEGSCLPGDRVFMVDGSVPMCDMAGQPYCDVSSALAAAGAGTEATVLIEAGAYIENVVVSSNAIVAIVAEGDATLAGNDGSASVTVNAMGVGYLQGLTVDTFSATGAGVESNGDVRLDDVTIRESEGGLVSTAGLVYLEDVRVINNTSTGISVSGTEEVTLRNVIVANNNGTTIPRGFVAASGTPFSMVYTTIVDNAGSAGGAINCLGEGQPRSVRNSILIQRNFANAVNCGEMLTIANSIIADVDYEGTNDNVAVADDLGLNFDSSYEIGPGSIAEGVAVWMDGDPLFDINGQMRPTVDGSPDAAGANLP